MAFDSIWKNLGGTQAFNAAANWEGDVPVDAESALISAGNAEITTGMDQSLLDLAQLSIGCGFEGSIGTPDDPLTLGDTTLLRVRAPSSKTLHLRIAEDKTCSKLTIHGTSNRPYACSIASGGSGSTLGLWDEVHVVSGLLHVTSSAKIDDLYVAPGGIVIIEHGATIDNIHNYGGRITNNTAIGTKLYQHNGTFIHQGTTAGGVNAGTMEIHGGDLLLNCKGCSDHATRCSWRVRRQLELRSREHGHEHECLVMAPGPG